MFNLYIDNEPLHPINLPKLCKIYSPEEKNILRIGQYFKKFLKTSKKENESQKTSQNSYTKMEEVYLNLLDLCEFRVHQNTTLFKNLTKQQKLKSESSSTNGSLNSSMDSIQPELKGNSSIVKSMINYQRLKSNTLIKKLSFVKNKQDDVTYKLQDQLLNDFFQLMNSLLNFGVLIFSERYSTL